MSLCNVVEWLEPKGHPPGDVNSSAASMFSSKEALSEVVILGYRQCL